jgi:hypothetical protein
MPADVACLCAQIKPGGMDLTWMVDDFEAFLAMEARLCIHDSLTSTLVQWLAWLTLLRCL